jgi:hypothetical protein
VNDATAVRFCTASTNLKYDCAPLRSVVRNVIHAPIPTHHLHRSPAASRIDNKLALLTYRPDYLFGMPGFQQFDGRLLPRQSWQAVYSPYVVSLRWSDFLSCHTGYLEPADLRLIKRHYCKSNSINDRPETDCVIGPRLRFVVSSIDVRRRYQPRRNNYDELTHA